MLLITSILMALAASCGDKAPFPYVDAEAIRILPGTTSEESGYFSLSEGKDGQIYVGSAKYGENSFLIRFDPKTRDQAIVLDTNKTCGVSGRGYASQAKLHTRNFVGLSGKIYVGSKQGYRKDGDTSDYPGGYVMSYDPATGKSECLGMPMKGQGVIDVVEDEARNRLFAVTCEDQFWMVGDLKGTAYRQIAEKLSRYAMTLLDHDGNAFALTDNFQLARFDAKSGAVTLRDIDIDGATWKREDDNAIPTWQIAADGRTAYVLLMNDARLIQLDLHTPGSGPIAGKRLGAMVEGKHPDSRCGMTIGPNGDVYAIVRVDNETKFGTGYLHHIAHYDPMTGKIRDRGVIRVKNPDYTEFNDATGKQKPYHHGFHTLPDGTLTPLHHHMALIVAGDGTIYITVICPFTLLRIEPER